MKKALVLGFLAFIVSIIATKAGDSVLHDFHSALTSIVYDAPSRQYEITIRVFSDDLETALCRQANRKIKVESVEGEAILMAYLQKTFRIRNLQSAKISWEFVGFESGPESSRIYLAYPCGPGGKLQVVNKFFMELFDDQKNIVNVIQGERSQSHLFTQGQESHEFDG